MYKSDTIWLHHHSSTPCRAFERLIKTGTLFDQPPHQPKWKAAKFSHLLQVVEDILIEGKVTENLQSIPYSSLEEAAAEHDVIDEICDAMDITSYATLWRLIGQHNPNFHKVKIDMIAEREPLQAQCAAKRLCGTLPCEFGYVQKDDTLKHHPLMQRFCSPEFQYFFMFTQLVYNVFLDAGKIEPEKWSRNRTAICLKGSSSMMDRVSHSLLKLGVSFICMYVSLYV